VHQLLARKVVLPQHHQAAQEAAPAMLRQAIRAGKAELAQLLLLQPEFNKGWEGPKWRAHDVVKQVLDEAQLYTTYLATDQPTGITSCHPFCNSAVSQQCIAAARGGHCSLCDTLFDIGLECDSICGGYASPMYKMLSIARAAGHHELWKQLLLSLTAEPRYGGAMWTAKAHSLSCLNCAACTA
jgi:hypothetical protein